MTSLVRIFPSLLVLSVLCASAFAQEQERTLAERISKPNKDLTFDTRQGSTGSKSFGSSKARVKEFGFSKSFGTKDFQAKHFRSKEYATNNAWMGDMKFQSKAANTSGKYKIPNLEKEAGQKTAAVKEAYDANKGVDVRAYAKGERPYLGREAEKMKNGIDPTKQPAGWQGEMKVLSINDIREMLNKNE